MKKIIWAMCNFAIGKCGANGELATTFADIGDAEENTTTMATDQGEVKELKKSGGVLVDRIEQEGVTYIETTLIDPTTLYQTLGLGTNSDTKVRVKTHVVEGNYSMRLTPLRTGGYGIEAPCTQISFLPQGEEAKGAAVKVRFTFLQGQQTTKGTGGAADTVDTYLYDKFLYSASSD